MNPVVVHVVRPYASEQEYLDAEAWSIDAKSMLLIDAEVLPTDTAVLFDVALSDGHKPIRAEGRVAGVIAPQGDRPGGMRVRFKRFGAATKAFIERAVQAKRVAPPERPSQPEAAAISQVELERPSQVELERPSQVELERPSQVEQERFSAPELRASMTELEPAPPLPASQREPSGVRPRVGAPVAPPANREELLQRLRGRRSG